MAELQEDLIEDILSRLPVRSLLRFRCVSKPWCALIDSSRFIKSHINRSIVTKTNLNLVLQDFRDYSFLSVDFNSLDSFVNLNIDSEGLRTEVLGSCNGLLCLFHADLGIVLWNPSTRKHRKLPDRPVENPSCNVLGQRVFYGFGYESFSEDYKVVRIVQHSVVVSGPYVFESQVDVYSLKSNLWRRVQGIPPSFGINVVDPMGALVDGALHWSGIMNIDSCVPNHFVIAFDLGVEQFRFMPHPEYSTKPFYIKVGSLCGCLCTLVCSSLGCFDIWVMLDYGVKESWTILVSVVAPGIYLSSIHLKPVTCSEKGGKILIQLDETSLVKCDTEKERIEEVNIHGMPDRFDSHLCWESLVQLDGDVGSEEKQLQAQPMRCVP